MASFQKVILLGRIGTKGELRFTGNETAVLNISVATNEFRGKGENKEEITEWHNVVVWGQSASYIDTYGQKGAQVLVEGKIKSSKYTDKEGVERYKTEINADRVQLVGKVDGNGDKKAEPEKIAAEDLDSLEF